MHEKIRMLLQKPFELQCAAIFQRISAAASNQITPPQFCDPKQKMGFCVNWWLPWSCMPNMALSHMCCMWNAQYEYLWIFQSGSSERFDDAFLCVNFRYSEKATKNWPIIHLLLMLVGNVKNRVEDEPNFCGLLRIS